jgi:signal transduction histidine kinase
LVLRKLCSAVTGRYSGGAFGERTAFSKGSSLRMNLADTFERQSRTVIVFEMVLLVLIVGAVDYVTGYQVSFFMFYGPPIFFTAWFCDKKNAFLVALLSGITWWWADFAAGHPYLTNWHEGWEVVMRVGFFIFIAIGSSALRARRDIAEARIALLEHSRRLEKEIITISERERERIGQDLHDGLCQCLAAIGCAAAALESDLERLQLSDKARQAGEVRGLLADAVMQTRNLARGLVPVETTANGLASALEELALSITRLARIDCRFEQPDEVNITEETTATHLFRIAQEAINNAIKHANARSIIVSLRARADAITLDIRDDGVGIDKSAGNSRGMGLKILQYRAHCLGGNVRVGPLPEGGTWVACTIPREGAVDRHETPLAEPSAPTIAEAIA